jgi:hypothetical protein
MRITVDVPDELLAAAKEIGNVQYEGALVLEALWQYVRRHRLADLSSMLGTVELDGAEEQTDGREE